MDNYSYSKEEQALKAQYTFDHPIQDRNHRVSADFLKRLNEASDKAYILSQKRRKDNGIFFRLGCIIKRIGRAYKLYKKEKERKAFLYKVQKRKVNR